jgi:putative heme-binding domain-containing protein
MRLRALLLAAGMLGVAGPGGAQLTQDHPGQYRQEDIVLGGRLYATQCTQCHGRDGDQISGIDLRRGGFRRSLSDDELARVITTGTPGGMPPFTLPPADLAGIVAYIRAGFDSTTSVRVGDAARGRSVFEGKGACGTCHRVDGRGPRLAPDLSNIGLVRTPAALERSIRDPSAGMMPINRPVRIVTSSGETIRGRRLNEDTATVQVLDDKERLRSIDKTRVRSFEVETKSPMPAYADRLTADEIADVVGYLVGLKNR